MRNTAKVHSTVSAWRSSSFGRWLRSGATLAASAALCAVAVGCGAPVDDEAAEEGVLEQTQDGEQATGEGAEIGNLSQAIRCADNNGNPINDGNCPWTGWSRLLPSGGAASDITHTRAPALCASPTGGFITISTDTSNRYRTLQWHFASKGPSWAFYGQNRQFNSKPACALREDLPSGQAGFIVAGKLNDNKIYASPGIYATVGVPQGNPTFESGFAAVSNTVYNTGGLPAISSVVDENGVGTAVITFMGDDNRTIFAHARQLPYNANSWSARITGPVLPAGFTVVGAPSITRLPVTHQIVVHARNNATGVDRIFETHIFAPGSGQFHFSSGIGSPSPSWQQLAVTGTINDEPSLTFTSGFGTTLYFRRNSQIVQTSAFPLGSAPMIAIEPNQIPAVTFASAPAASADVALATGAHVVTARTNTNQIFVAETFGDSLLVP